MGRLSVLKLAGAAWVAAAMLACAHEPPAPSSPLDVELEVTGLKKEEQKLLEDGVCGIEGVSNCKLKKKKKKLTLSFAYVGTVPQLREKIAKLPHPGLKDERRAVTLRYEGFDNVPPDLTILTPNKGEVHTVPDVEVKVKVEAKDIEEVLIADEPATLLEPGLYLRHAVLKDGERTIVVKAIDAAGNEAVQTVNVLVDTRAPALAIRVKKQTADKMLLEGNVERGGRVTIDGKPAEVSFLGGFSREIAIDPDKKTTYVEAVDEHGNSAALEVELKDGWSGRIPEPEPKPAAPAAEPKPPA